MGTDETPRRAAAAGKSWAQTRAPVMLMIGRAMLSGATSGTTAMRAGGAGLPTATVVMEGL